MIAFDITQPPPTREVLARLRSQQSEQLATISSHERLCYVIGAIGLITTALLWLYQHFSGGSVPGTFVGVLAGAGAGAGAFALAGVVLARVFAYTLAIVGAFTLSVGVLVVTLAFAFTLGGTLTGVGAGAGEIGCMLVSVFVYNKWINTPREQALASLEALAEIEHSEYPDECIQFVAWCKADPTLAAYQHHLATQGRKPVRGEYDAAKAWIEPSKARQRAEAEAAMAEVKAAMAKEACDELGRPI